MLLYQRTDGNQTASDNLECSRAMWLLSFFCASCYQRGMLRNGVYYEPRYALQEKLSGWRDILACQWR